MRILDCCIFNNEFEKELLLLKLKLESPLVDRFIITECAYTYRGEFKGEILQKLFENDSRFAEFMNKITVVTVPDNLSRVTAHSLDGVIDPIPYAQAEIRLREAPTSYILEMFSDEDYIFVTDTDEVFDFQEETKRQQTRKLLDFGQALQFDRIRFTYDFDNLSLREKGDCITPAYRVRHLKDGTAKLSDKKWIGALVKIQDPPLLFEYCSCFSYEALVQKYASSLHTRWSEENIRLSVLTNTWTRTDYQRMDFNNRYLWFDKVQLTEHNSPAYVRENLPKLKTNLVPDNYRENRIKFYGKDPYP